MRTVSIEFLVPKSDPDAVFALVSDFGRYAELSPAIGEVGVSMTAGSPTGRRVAKSSWSLDVRGDALAWVQRDHVDPVARSVRFTRIEGGFDALAGDWLVRQAGADVTVRFGVTFDLGRKSPAALEAIVDTLLREAVDTVLRGLLGADLIGLDTSGAISRLAA